MGTEPGHYRTTFDVGNELRFVFEDAKPGRSYYFAVAAYTSANILGPLSAEVSARIDKPQQPSNSVDTASSLDVPETPAVILTMPHSSSFTTSKSSALLGGVAVDDQVVTAVHWKNDRGGSGLATGTDQWMAAVPLRPGRNEITLTVIDDSSNSSSIRFFIYRTTILRRVSPVGPRVD